MKTRLICAIALGICLTFFMAGLSQAQQQVTITCDNDSAVVVPEKLDICPGDSVTFLAVIAAQGGCANGVNITGDAPIGTFSLTGSDSTETITFADTGHYDYTVTKQTKGATQAQIVVLESCNPYCGTPTLTQWGVIIFSGLFILALIFVIRRRRVKLPTPA